MVNQNTFNNIIMREITTSPQKMIFFFLFLIDLAPHIIILCVLELILCQIDPKTFDFKCKIFGLRSLRIGREITPLCAADPEPVGCK